MTGYSNTVADQTVGQARGLPPKLAKTIPFDYVFEFKLTGQRGNRVQNVVEISIEGVFVATSIGYSLVLDEQRRPRSFPPVVDQRTLPQNLAIVPFFSEAVDGNLDAILVAGMPEAEIAVLDPTADPTATDPALSFILGEDTIGPDGTVTVALTRPINTGIIRAWDKTNNLLSQLLAVGSPSVIEFATNSSTTPSTPVIGPNPATRQLPAAGDMAISIYGSPGQTVDVFLLESAMNTVTQVNDDLILEDTNTFGIGTRTGRKEVPLGNPLSPGDVLLVQSEMAEVVIPFSMFTIPRPKLSTLTLGALTAGLEKIGTDLTDGFRLNPNFANLAVADLPFDQISPGDRDKIFETGCAAAEEVSFLYSIDVVDTGRELQSRPIHNIAGLGIANGDRPFRPFAKPIVFAPRSSTRIQIEERSGPPGTLFIVLQGYKLLGTARIPE
jgi:hypothetical protein